MGVAQYQAIVAAYCIAKNFRDMCTVGFWYEIGRVPSFYVSRKISAIQYTRNNRLPDRLPLMISNVRLVMGSWPFMGCSHGAY